MTRFATILFLLSTFCLSSGLYAEIPAFPGAEGFGALTRGGRGGQVTFVTNLNASGPGSLKAALEASGARIVVFKVSGMIDWTSIGGTVAVRNPYLTVAGQTAPGEGIMIKNGMISVKTHDVVVRGLRFRVGDSQAGFAAGNRNGIEVIGSGAYNVIFDHCSVAWGVDENAGVTGSAHDVTIQYCYVTEGLRCSIHPEGCHSKGLMANHSAGGNISFHHNVLAHNVDRNPNLVTPGNLESVNNVVYNYNFGGRFDNGAQVHFLGNRYIPGPDSPGRMGLDAGTNAATSKVYVVGNIGPGRPSNSGSEWTITNASTSYRSTVELFEANIVPDDVDAIWPSILDQAGALPHDDVDNRAKDEILSGTGGWIDSQQEVGGWPTIPTASAPRDSDNDGMPDEWEVANGLDPSNSGDANLDADQDGYTNIEEHINGIFEPADGTTGDDGKGPNLPDGFALHQNFPNPFNPTTTIGYMLNENAFVTLEVFNLLGHPIRSLVNAPRNAGYNAAAWDGRNANGGPVTSGVYIYRLTIAEQSGAVMTSAKRMILVK